MRRTPLLLDTGHEGKLESAPSSERGYMSRDTTEAFDHPMFRFEPVVTDDHERAILASRLAALEQAHAELLERVARYERERVEIRARLARLLTQLGPGSV
jgi:hypothetical protein